MKHEEKELILRLAQEDVRLHYEPELKEELIEVCHQNGVEVENAEDAYDLYMISYASERNCYEHHN